MYIVASHGVSHEDQERLEPGHVEGAMAQRDVEASSQVSFFTDVHSISTEEPVARDSMPLIPANNLATVYTPTISSNSTERVPDEPTQSSLPKETGIPLNTRHPKPTPSGLDSASSNIQIREQTIERMLSQEPPSAWRSRFHRRREVDGGVMMNGTAARRGTSPARSTTTASSNTFSVGISTLPPSYAEYE
jgi:hypothetical protein